MAGTRRNFNPRTREGCDCLSFVVSKSQIAISIHAPVKGATSWTWPSCSWVRNFNPRTREGCDCLSFVGSKSQIAISIHAPVKGATMEGCKCLKQSRWFQSTHPWRVRLFISPLSAAEACDISIHAPVKGATISAYGWLPGCSQFQSTHPWRVRPSRNTAGTTRRKYFNPRTREGCDYKHTQGLVKVA